MCVHLYIHNKYTQYTHTSYINKNFYFGLIAINRLTSLMYNPKSEKVGTVWKTQIKKESSDF